MGNPLSDSLGSNPFPTGGNRNIFTLIREFNKFLKTFKGNPETTLQQMLNNGQLTQDQFDKGISVARNIQGFFMR